VISKCANPHCNRDFRYSHEGRLFPYEIKDPEEPCRDVPAVICEKKPGRATIYFWLCAQCCERFTLRFAVSTGLRLISVHSEDNANRDTDSQVCGVREPEIDGRRYA
jgi:hypothetical protein